MLIAACMSWYDERPAVLRMWVEQVYSFADLVIAHDGAWEFFPGGKPRSSYRQRRALRAACSEHGIDLYLRTNGSLWPSEVNKRAAELEFAAGLLTRKDWLLRLDADEFVFGQQKKLRSYLRRAKRDVATVMFHQQNIQPLRHPRLIRALPGLTVKGLHHFVCADGKYLVGSRQNVVWGTTPREAVQIVHHPERSRQRLEARRKYYRRRDQSRVQRLPA